MDRVKGEWRDGNRQGTDKEENRVKWEFLAVGGREIVREGEMSSERRVHQRLRAILTVTDRD